MLAFMLMLNISRYEPGLGLYYVKLFPGLNVKVNIACATRLSIVGGERIRRRAREKRWGLARFVCPRLSRAWNRLSVKRIIFEPLVGLIRMMLQKVKLTVNSPITTFTPSIKFTFFPLCANERLSLYGQFVLYKSHATGSCVRSVLQRMMSVFPLGNILCAIYQAINWP